MTTIDVINKQKFLNKTTRVIEKMQRDMTLARPHTKIKVTHNRRAFYTIDADPNDIMWGMKYGRGDDEKVETVEEVEPLDWSGADSNTYHAADR